MALVFQNVKLRIQKQEEGAPHTLKSRILKWIQSEFRLTSP